MKIRVADKFLLPHFKQWREILLSGESGNVFFLPYTGLNYRLVQFLSWWRKTDNPALKVLYPERLSLEDIDELEKEVPSNFKLILVANSYFLEEPLYLLNNLKTVLLLNNTNVLVFHQALPTDLMRSAKDNIRLLFFKDWLYFPLHTYKETVWFINQLVKDWKIKNLSELEARKIYRYSGGYLYLVKHILRSVKNGEFVSDVFDSESLYEKEDFIWKSFPGEVKELLTQIVLGSGLDNVALVKFGSYINDLNSFGFFKEHSGKVSFPGFIKRVVERNVNKNVSFTNNRLIISGVDVTAQLSRTQLSIFKHLFSAYEHGRYVTRDELAQAIWGKSWTEKYSDWAIDQHIRRLKLKLAQLRLPLTVSSIRNQGYRLKGGV